MGKVSDIIISIIVIILSICFRWQQQYHHLHSAECCRILQNSVDVCVSDCCCYCVCQFAHSLLSSPLPFRLDLSACSCRFLVFLFLFSSAYLSVLVCLSVSAYICLHVCEPLPISVEVSNLRQPLISYSCVCKAVELRLSICVGMSLYEMTDE